MFIANDSTFVIYFKFLLQIIYIFYKTGETMKYGRYKSRQLDLSMYTGLEGGHINDHSLCNKSSRLTPSFDV